MRLLEPTADPPAHNDGSMRTIHRPVTRPIASMDAARSTSRSSLPPRAVPVAGACAASQCLTGSDLRSAPGLGSACVASASGRVSGHRRLTATACHRKVGSSSVRRTRSLRWGARLSRKKQATANSKARLQGMIAAARILRPNFSIPSLVGLGSPLATSASQHGSLVTHQHRILQAHL